jgi:NAD-dependent DNA ligase
VTIKSATLTSLLDEHSCSMDANSIMRVMMRYGLAEDAEYISTTGSGEVKRFRRLTDEGLNYGVNEASSGHDIKTSPRFYMDTFPALVSLVVSYLHKESEDMQAQASKPKPLAGKVIAVFGSFTLIGRNELRQHIEELGALNAVSISQKTDIVIFGDGDHRERYLKAKGYHAEIWDEVKMIEVIGLPTQ